METIMSKKEKERAVPEEMLTKEFLSQFKTEQDVSKFLKKLHAPNGVYTLMRIC